MMRILMGCRVCRKPLEPIEAVKKVNTRKPHKPHGRPGDSRQDKTEKVDRSMRLKIFLIESRVAHLDSHPMATICGHIFHIGCLKRLISEGASCRIECPTCGKPVVLAQLRGIKFFYPPKCDSMSIQIQKMNEENNILTKELTEAKKLRTHNQHEHDVVTAKIGEVKQNMDMRAVEFSKKVKELTGMALGYSSHQDLTVKLRESQKRIMELSERNSNLLRHLESIVSQLSDEEISNEFVPDE